LNFKKAYLYDHHARELAEVNSLFIYAPRISAKMIDRIERWLLGKARLRRSRD
jgi:hypothetical protein